MARVILAGKIGFVDITGKEAIVPQFEEAESFKSGVANVKLAGKALIIDKTGKEKK
jgi:hypothetical protein